MSHGPRPDGHDAAPQACLRSLPFGSGGRGGSRHIQQTAATFSKQNSANRAEQSQTRPPHSANTEDTFRKQPGHSHKQEPHMQKTADMTLKTDFSTLSKQRGHSRTLAFFRLQMWSCICFVACLCGLSALQRRKAGVGRRIAIKGCMFSEEVVGTGTADRSSHNICSSAARGRLCILGESQRPPIGRREIFHYCCHATFIYPLPGSIRDLTSMHCCELENQPAYRSYCEFKSIQSWQRKIIGSVEASDV